MLKIYRAEQLHDELKLYKGIQFENGVFDSNVTFGYGSIKNKKGIHGEQYALYEFQNLCMDYYKNIETKDGFLVDFGLWNPQNPESLKKYIEESKKYFHNTEKDYENYGLNEEAILLLTCNVDLKYEKDQKENIVRIFGRWPSCGGYIIFPGAQFKMGIDEFNPDKIKYSDYEVFQSKGLGKQLELVKLDR